MPEEWKYLSWIRERAKHYSIIKVGLNVGLNNVLYNKDTTFGQNSPSIYQLQGKKQLKNVLFHPQQQRRRTTTLV